VQPMATGYAKIPELTFPNEHPAVKESRWGVPDATKTLSAMRILFSSIFVFDGAMKWILLQNGQMQSVVQGSVLGAANPLYGSTFIANDWLFFGVLIGTCETLAGLAPVAGLFQRPAAIGAASIMGFIWAYGGFGGFGQPGCTDPGRDLMLGLVFAALVFAPAAYGLASRFPLRERWAGASFRAKALRILVA